MQLDHLLSRVEDSVLQQIIGPSALRLLTQIDPTLRRPSNLKKVLIGLFGTEGLLDDPARRRIFIDLLKPLEAEQLYKLLTNSTTDKPYEQLKSLRITRETPREASFYGYFGIDAPERPTTNLTPPAFEVEAKYTLFPHQRRAASEVNQILRKPGSRVLLHMPTGSGKTRTAMSAIADHLRSVERGLVIWLAYSEELCEQATQEFERAWALVGDRTVRVNRFWGDHSLSLEDIQDGILVAGLFKITNLARSNIYPIGQLGSRCTLLVLDEAHQAVAPTYRSIIDALLVHGHAPSFLGLSATPGRSWNRITEDQELAEFFDRCKVTLTVNGYDSPIRYLEEEGYLARPQMQPLFVHNGFELSRADLQKLTEDLEVPQSVLNQLAEDEQRNLAIINRITELTYRHRRILLFATTVQHASLIAIILQARRINALVVTGRSTDAERKRAIETFRGNSEEPIVLCNYGVLTTGFDAPKTSAVVIARPTKSLVLYSQMMGRAIRGPRAGGNATADVVTVVDTALPGFRDVAEAFTNWEDVWQ